MDNTRTSRQPERSWSSTSRPRRRSPTPSGLVCRRSSDRPCAWSSTTNDRSGATGRSPRSVSSRSCAAPCTSPDLDERRDRHAVRSVDVSRPRSSVARPSVLGARRRSTTDLHPRAAMSEVTGYAPFAHRRVSDRVFDERSDRIRAVRSSPRLSAGAARGRNQVGLNVTGRWTGPKMAVVEGFQSIAPSTTRSGIRRARIGRASWSSARASAAPRQ